MTSNITPIPFTTDRLIKATAGVFLCNNPENIFSLVSINSKDIGKNDLFIAIKGKNHDGHKFINDVIDKGIKGVIIEEEKKDNFPINKWRKNGISCIAVKNTIKALGALAHSQRIESGVKLIAITGSNGKTSTRTMTTAVLQQQFVTHSTSGNFNNEIGLPLTLLKLGYKHQWAVVELGMNAPGEIERLGKICKPDIGIITNIGSAHLEGLGSIENIAKAKAELFLSMDKNGTAIVNDKMPLLENFTKDIRPKLLLFGDTKEASAKASSVKSDNGCISFTIEINNTSTPVILKTPGVFMVSNALAAASAGTIAGITMGNIKKGLESFSPVKGRMNIIKSPKGFFIIDDSYNANPDSMIAAIQTLKKLKGKSRSFFVAGDMLELGENTDILHQKIGEFSAKSGIGELCITGKNAHDVSTGALNYGMKPEYIFTGTKKEIIDRLTKKLKKDDWILVKGSRSMAMEEIVAKLSKNA